MPMNNQRILRNVSSSFLSQIIIIVLGFVIPRLTVAGYGSEVNGLLSSVTQSIIYLGLLETGIQAVAMQSMYKPVCTGDKRTINEILSAVNISYKRIAKLYLLILLLLSAVYSFSLHSDTLPASTIFGVVFFSGFGNVILFLYQGKYQILLQVEGKNYLLINIQTVIRTTTNVVKILLLSLGCDIVLIVFSTFLISLLQAVYIGWIIRRNYGWIDLDAEPAFHALKQKNSMLIHQIAGVIFQNTDIVLLTFFCGLKVASVYSIYRMIVAHVSTVLGNIYHSFGFGLGQLYNTAPQQYPKKIDTVGVYYSGLVVSVYTVVAVLLVPFVELYTAGLDDIRYADHHIAAAFVIVEILTYLRLPLVNTIHYAGHFRQTLLPTILEAVINLTVSLALVKSHGIVGILTGTAVALIYRNVDIWLYVNHKLLNRKARKTFSIYGITLILTGSILIFFARHPIAIHSYGEFLLAGIIITPIILGLYLGLLSLIFPTERRLARQYASGLLKRRRSAPSPESEP